MLMYAQDAPAVRHQGDEGEGLLLLLNLNHVAGKYRLNQSPEVTS